MNESNKKFFERIEMMSKENPLIKVELAAKEVALYVQEFCMDSNKRLKGDLWVYTLSVLAGISCIKAGVLNITDVIDKNEDNSGFFPILPVDTKAGKFFVGDAINEFLMNNRISVLNVFYSIYKNKHKEVVLPDIREFVEKNTKNMGNEDYRLWDNLHNPYKEKDDAKQMYENIKKHIEPFKVQEKYMPALYGFALAEVTEKVAGIFPKHLNCYEMIVETIVFNAHMDYL